MGPAWETAGLTCTLMRAAEVILDGDGVSTMRGHCYIRRKACVSF